MYDFAGNVARRNAFLAALRGSHEVVVRARLYEDATATTPVDGFGDLNVTSGSIRVTSASGVRRVLTASIATPDGLTSTLTDALSVFGAEVGVERGIRYPNGRVDLVPVGRFRIDSAEDDLDAPGSVSITAPSHEARIQDDRFTSPRVATVGITIGEQITRLLQETIPDVAVYVPTSTPLITGAVVWEEDRWAAVSDLAASIGCVAFADVTGAFRVEAVKTMIDAPDWMIDSGARGVLVGGRRTRSREGVYSVVVASSAPTDGSEPVSFTVGDHVITSPTYVNGPFGRVTRFYSSPLLTTEDQCQSAAWAILSKVHGAKTSLSLSSIVNPALEVGDRIDVFLPDGGLQRHIADSFDLPLGPDGVMAIETRTASFYEEPQS